jgi:hypothetical protein
MPELKDPVTATFNCYFPAYFPEPLSFLTQLSFPIPVNHQPGITFVVDDPPFGCTFAKKNPKK